MDTSNHIKISNSNMNNCENDDKTEDTFDTNRACMVCSLAVSKKFKNCFVACDICQEYLHYPCMQFVLKCVNFQTGCCLFCKLAHKNVPCFICGVEDHGFKLPVLIEKVDDDYVEYDTVLQNEVYIHSVCIRSTSLIKINNNPTYLYLEHSDFKSLNKLQNQSMICYYCSERKGYIQRCMKCYKVTAHLYCVFKNNIIAPGSVLLHYDVNCKIQCDSDIQSESFICRYCVMNTESSVLSDEFPSIPQLYIDRAKTIPELTFKYNDCVSRIVPTLKTESQFNDEEKHDLIPGRINEHLMDALYNSSMDQIIGHDSAQDYNKPDYYLRNRQSKAKENENEEKELDLNKCIDFLTLKIEAIGGRLLTEEEELKSKIEKLNEKLKEKNEKTIEFRPGKDYIDPPDFFGGIVLDDSISDCDELEDVKEDNIDPETNEKYRKAIYKNELKKYISNERISYDVQAIADRVSSGFYPTIELLETDIECWINKLEKRYMEYGIKPNSPKYFNNLRIDVTKMMHEGGALVKYDEHFHEEFKILMRERNKNDRLRGNWNKECPPISNFEELKCLDRSIDKLVKTSKKFTCDGTCCDEYSKLGPYENLIQTWKTECVCRKNKTECNEDCDCKGSSKYCKNSEIRNKKCLVVNKDVKCDVKAWGMDHYTLYAIMFMMPWGFNDIFKFKFVDEYIKPELLKCDDKGWDLTYCLKQILKKKDIPELYSTFAKILLSTLNVYPDLIEENFRIHSIGVCVVCTKKEGVKCNQLISEYLGEVYRPYRWREEIDCNLKAQKLKIIDQDTRDFYNMIFDRHLNDPEGIDYLIIDPKHKGNFCSRMNHSCEPNTAIFSTIVDGKYRLAAYAIKDIKYEEELTFDYYSITDDLEEHKNSICLCGKYNCHQKYISYESARATGIVIDSKHCYIQRVSAIIKTSCFPCKLTEEDLVILSKHHIGSKLLDKSPNWLQKWLALICRFIEFEYSNYANDVKKWNDKISPEEAIECAKNVYDQRLNGLCATVDMISHQLKLMDEDGPPIILLSDSEIINILWKGDNSIKAQLIQTLEHLEPSKRKNKILERLKNPIDEIVNNTEDRMLHEIFQIFYKVVDSLKKLYSCRVYLDPIKDILILYTKIGTYFKINPKYKEVFGEPIIIEGSHLSDSINLEKENSEGNIMITKKSEKDDKVIYELRVKYKPYHIFEKLIYWHKQDSFLDNDKAFLIEKRGTVIYPKLTNFIFPPNEEENQMNLENSKDEFKSLLAHKVNQSEYPEIISSSKTSNQYRKYPHKVFNSREEFLSKWRENYSDSWDYIKGWEEYNDPYQMMGSIQLEETLKYQDDDITKRYEEDFKNVVTDLIKL